MAGDTDATVAVSGLVHHPNQNVVLLVSYFRTLARSVTYLAHILNTVLC